MEFLWGIFILILIAVPAAFIVLLIINMNKVSAHEKRLWNLEAQIRKLTAPSVEGRVAAPSAPPTPSLTQPPVRQAEPTTQAAAAVRLPPVPPAPSRTKEEWEALIGGKLLNRIGALALIIGIGFFLKYAFDRDWITETIRVLIGAGVGSGLLIVGARSHARDYQVFSQGLIGAGIAILYLSVYASFNFYQLVGQAPAFVLMSVVTVIAFFQAFTYNSLAVSLLGWAGGFLTPILLTTGQVNEVGLFSYLILLTAGLLAVVLLREGWSIIEPLTLGATYLMYLTWHVRYYNSDHLFISTAFVTFVWLIFFAMELLRRGKPRSSLPELHEAIAALSPSFFFSALYAIINPHHPRWMGGIALLLGAIYIAVWWQTRTRYQDNFREHTRLALIGTGFVVIATAIEYSGFTTAVLWSLEGLVLFLTGRRLRLRYLWLSGPALFGLAFLKLIATKGALQFIPIEDFSPVLNQRFLAFTLVTGALAASSFVAKSNDDAAARALKQLMSYALFALILILVTSETRDLFERIIRSGGSEPAFRQSDAYRNLINGRELATSGVWLTFSVVLMTCGIWLRSREPRFAAIALFGLSILKMFIFDLSFLDTFHRIFSFIGLGIILLGVSYFYQKNKTIILGEPRRSTAS